MKNIFWLRRDLRLDDNTALYHALAANHEVQLIFIFDKNILSELSEDDPRVNFIHDELRSLDRILKEKFDSSIWFFHGDPLDIFMDLASKHKIATVYSNEDYEPYAISRDESIMNELKSKGIEFIQHKDHVIFSKSDVLKDDGKPYTVFTPYKRKWLAKLIEHPIQIKSSGSMNNYATIDKSHPLPGLKELGFIKSSISIPSKTVSQELIRNYGANRDYPALDATSRLGIHFRFGTISIRKKVLAAEKLNETYLSELIWRDFYAQILYHFPKVVDQAFREKYDRLEWLDDPDGFHAWCVGKTGYPLVDAGMRQLNNTGYMHNRVRMVTASFLTKHLLIDWRLGEAYFAKKLLDFELASNNGGWQWSAGCGTDAAPYFRIFNPESQQKKFDKDLEYIKKWIPEFGTDAYPDPIVDHKQARARCLATYKRALN